MERVINTDNCMVCGMILEENRYVLTAMLNFTQKSIYSLIEEFTETYFSEEIVNDASVCSLCVMKFNEYDEYQKMANMIQEEVSSLFFSTLNQTKDVEEEEQLKEEIEDTSDNVLVYQTIDDLESHLGDEEMILAQEVADIPDDLDIVEVDEIERKNLPRKFQTAQIEEKQKIVKTRSIKSENSDSFTIVQLENNVRLWQCDICNRTFKEKSKLKSHKEIHTTERNVFCPTCGKSFKTAACLRSHKRIHNPTLIECDHCGKNYTQKSELIKHINVVHFNRRDFTCEYCNAKFGCRGHLKAHYLIHQQHRGISCGICGYSFHTKAKLERHMRSHTGQRDYECGLCGKRFLYSYNVSAHIRHVHWKEKRRSDERSKSCSICQKKFNSSLNLRVHLENVHQLIEDIDDSVIIEEDSVQYEGSIEFESVDC